MSTTIDERVVSMQFDNAQFERNVQQSMSTLDKLKQKLHLPGAVKGLNDVNAAAKNVNLSPIGAAAETVGLKFNAMYTMADQALRNITNSVINSAKRMVKAVTIDPIKTGFSEYETQINATQTILANVGHKGKTLEDVNNALEELNKYADQTIYNFTEMTKNIGLFTNAGVGLDESVAAIKGFSNAAAMAGTDSTSASRAMYQLSQAMSSGQVRLMDWKSLETANITGERFQETLKMTARAHGIAIDDMITKHGSFRETLSEDWLTADLMAEALNHYTLSTETMTEAEIKANRERLKSLGYTDDQIDKLFELGTEATNAATKVKTFSQLWDVIKESAQSGWSKTWKLIIGDFEEAKNLLTPIANAITGFIDKMSNARNNFIESVLGRNFIKTADKVWDAFKPIAKTVDGVKDAVKGVTKTLEEHKEVVDSIIRGEWGNGQERWDALTEAGYDWAHAQNLVNEELGYSLRRETSFGEAQEKTAASTSELVEEDAKLIEGLVKLSDAELKAKGYTDDQIKAFRELEEVADKLGLSISDLLLNIDEIDGRWLIINSFKNIGKSLAKIFKSIGQAWNDVFGSKNYAADFVFNLITAFHKLSTKLVMSDDTAEKLRRTFAGLFAILDVLLTLTAGPIKIAFKIFNKLLNVFGMDILDVTAGIGDVMVKFSDWLDKFDVFGKGIKFITPFLKKAVSGVKNWFNWLKEGGHSPEEIANSIIQGLSKGVKMVGEIFGELKKKIADKIGTVPEDLIAGLTNGIRDKAGFVWDVVIELGSMLLEKLKNVLGIHSPSTETYEVGVNFIQGFFNAVKDKAVGVWNWIKEFGLKCIDVIKNIDFGSLFAGALAGGVIYTAVKFVNVLDKLSGPFDEFAEVLTKVKKVVGAFKGTVKSFNLLLKAEAFKTMAMAIAIIAGAIVALTYVDTKKAWQATGMIAVIAIALAGAAWILSKAVDGFGVAGDKGVKKEKNFVKLIALLWSIAGAIAVLVIAAKILGGMEESELKQAGVCVGALLVVMGLMALITKIPGMHDIGRTLIEMSGTMFILAIVVKMLGDVSDKQLIQAAKGMGMLIVVITLLTLIAMIPGVKKAELTLLSIASAMLVLTIVIKMLAGITGDELKAAIPGFVMLLAIIAILLVGVTLFTKFADNENELKRVGVTLLLMSISIGILAAIAILLGHIDPDRLTQGLIAVGVLSAFMFALILATSKAKDCWKSLLVMAITIAVLTACVIALSFITPEKLVAPTAALGSLMGLFALMESQAGKGKKATKSLLAMTLAIAVMATAIYMLAQLPASSVIASAVSMGLLMGVMVGVLKVCQSVGKKAKQALKGVLALTALAIPLYIFIGAIALLSGINNARDNVLNLIVLIGAMTILLAPLTLVGKFAKQALKGVLALTAIAVPLYIFIGALALLSCIGDVRNNIESLVTLIVAMSLMLLPLTLVGTFAGQALAGVIALTALAVPLLIFIGAIAILDSMGDVGSSIDMLTGMLTTLTNILVILAIVGPLAIIGVTALTALTVLMVGIAGLAIAIGGIMEKFPALQSFLNTGIPVLEQLAEAVGSCIGKLIAGFMGAVAEGLPEMGLALSQFMINATPFIVGAKMVNGSVLEGVGVLAASVLALTAADLIEGISSFLQGGSSFADLGTELSNFIINAMPFILAAPLLDNKVASGVKTIAEAIMILTAADLVEGLTSWLTGGNSLGSFAEQLPLLGQGIAGFAEAVSGYDSSNMNTVVAAADAIKTLAQASKAIPNTGGLLQDLVGENDLTGFAKSMPLLGDGIVAFAEAANDMPEGSTDKVSAAADAIKGLANATKAIPNTGGWVQKLIGENDLTKFATQMPLLGTGILAFANSVSDFNETKVDHINAAIDAIASLIKATNALPNTGGWIQKIIGENDLTNFSVQMPLLGAGLCGFVNSTSDLDFTNAEKSLDFLGKFATFASSYVTKIDDIGDFAVAIADNLGEKVGVDIQTSTLDVLAETLPTLGDAVASFADKMNAVDESKILAMGTIVQILDILASNGTLESAKSTVNLITDALGNMADNLDSFMTSMSYYTDEEIAAEVNKIKNLVDGFANIKSTDFANIDAFAAKLSEFSKTLTNTKLDTEDFGTKIANFFTDAITNISSEPVDKFEDYGGTLVSAVLSGLKTDAEGSSNAFTIGDTLDDLLLIAAASIPTENTKQAYVKIGANLVKGFANGIKLNKWIAENAARSMAAAAAEAAKDELDEHSPSKVGYEIGDFFGIAFVNAIVDNVSRAYKAGTEVANSAKEGLGNAISKIRNFIDADIDVQPTIRPVLDLSDVRTGANSISNMFRNGVTIGANANINAVNASMRGYRQNGNDDVVSAIDGLRSDVKNLEAASYNINGVTYDDGSNIADAVKSIVTAARVRRRS